MRRYYGIYIIISIIMVIAAASAFSQDGMQAAENTEKAEAAAPVQAPVVPQPKEAAIYGEVQAVNAVAKTLSVQYYDYDSDSEKTAEITIGSETTMENATGISDIKKGDWVDVTYNVSGGKNAAKTVAVEKEEPAPEPVTAAAGTGTMSDE